MSSLSFFNIRNFAMVGLLAMVALAIIITIPQGVVWTPQMQEKADAIAKEAGDEVVIQREGGGAISAPIPPPGPPNKPKCQNSARYGWRQLLEDLKTNDAIRIKDSFGGITLIRKMTNGEIMIAEKITRNGLFQFVSLSDEQYLSDIFARIIQMNGWNPNTATSMIPYLMQLGAPMDIIPTTTSQNDLKQEMIWDWEADCP